ncbi:hypothetical protein C3L33_13490, partial [Rhododendron williamsianum]
MVRSSENWERLVQATLRREKLRHEGRGGHERVQSGIAGSVLPSLTRETNIDLILQASDEIQSEDPNVARIQKPTLSNINLDIPFGSLVAVVGGTGEEKMSLILAMIGELPPVDDSTVVIRGTIAYGHDLAEIGERGVNISAGQKQRVSMARAVYSNADVYIFDDPLSALDAHVGRQVFSYCIKEELQGKTRVLVTNQLHFLPQVDKIILINKGMVKEKGTFEELSRSGILFQKLMENAEKMEEHVDEKEDDNNSDFKSSKSADSVMQNGLPESGNPKSTRKVVKSVLIKQEEREAGVVSWYKDALGGTWKLHLATYFILIRLLFQIAT